MKRLEHAITLVDEGIECKIRVDTYISQHEHSLSRSAISSQDSHITVNGKTSKKSKKISNGDTVGVSWTEQVFDNIEGQDIPLRVIYEDEDLLVIDKQQDLVVHPAIGNPDGTLVNALVYRYGLDFLEDDQHENSDWPVDETRPGIVHRLDKDTSGLIIVAKNRQAVVALSEQFKSRTVVKYYIALVKGTMGKKRGTIETPIGRSTSDRKKFAVRPDGKEARTDYLVLRQFKEFALVRIRIYTGRTHQIRVHMASIGHPLIGDTVYGRRLDWCPDAHMMLHSRSLEIEHPRTKERIRFAAGMPIRFKELIRGASRSSLM